MPRKKALKYTHPNTTKRNRKVPDALYERLNIIRSHEYQYTAEDCDCQYCLHFSEEKGKCVVDNCVCMPERLCAGSVHTDELYGLMFVETAADKLLSHELKRPYIETLFVNAEHNDIWRILRKAKILRKKSSFAYAAALFLLTSSRQLWNRAKHHVMNETIRFRDIDINGIDTDGYAIFKAAKELYSGEQHVHLSELSDSSLFSDSLLRLVINALVVHRHGVRAVKF